MSAQVTGIATGAACAAMAMLPAAIMNVRARLGVARAKKREAETNCKANLVGNRIILTKGKQGRKDLAMFEQASNIQNLLTAKASADERKEKEALQKVRDDSRKRAAMEAEKAKVKKERQVYGKSKSQLEREQAEKVQRKNLAIARLEELGMLQAGGSQSATKQPAKEAVVAGTMNQRYGQRQAAKSEVVLDL